MKLTIKQLKQLIKEQIEDGGEHVAGVEDKTTLELATEIEELKETVEELKSRIEDLESDMREVSVDGPKSEMRLKNKW